MTRWSAGRLSCFSRNYPLLSYYPLCSRLGAPPARGTLPPGVGAGRPDSPGGWFAAAPFPPRWRARPCPRRTHSRPGPHAALAPAPSSHPTLSRPRHLTPPPSPAAPRTRRPGPASRSPLTQTAHLPALRPWRLKKHFPERTPQPSLPPRSLPAPRSFFFLGEGGCRLGLKAIDLYVLVPAPEAAPAARAGAAAAAAASGVASLLP